MVKMRKMRKVREGLQLSLRDVGKDLEVDYSLISYWESGRRNPSKRNIKKLEAYFGKPIDYLMDIDEHRAHKATARSK